jgi:hypothetical protein
MAYKKDTRQRVKVLNCDIPYLKGMVGRVEEINGIRLRSWVQIPFPLPGENVRYHFKVTPQTVKEV